MVKPPVPVLDDLGVVEPLPASFHQDHQVESDPDVVDLANTGEVG